MSDSCQPDVIQGKNRAILAAYGVFLLDAFELLDLWPPIESPYYPTPAAEQVLRQACRLGGWSMSRAGDDKIILQRKPPSS